MVPIQYLPSTLSHTVTQNTTTKTYLAGSTWICDYNGKPWPVVITDHEGLPTRFLNMSCASTSIAVIVLGKRIYVWVSETDLKPYKPSTKFAESSTCLHGTSFVNTSLDDDETDREKAFYLDAPTFHDAEYWKLFIRDRNETQITNWRKQHHPHGRSDKKRELSAKLKLDSDDEDEDPSEIFKPFTFVNKGVRSSPSDRWKRKQHRRSVLKHAQEPWGPRRKTNTFESVLPDAGRYFRSADVLHSVKEIREGNEDSVRSAVKDPSWCYLFIGPLKDSLRVQMKTIDEHDFLRLRKQFKEEYGTFVDLSGLDVPVESIGPVQEFILTGDFDPRLRIPKSGPACLVGLVPDISKAVVDLAEVYRFAALLQAGALQQLVCRKLDVLYPLDCSSLLKVAIIIAGSPKWGWEGESDIKTWIARSIVESWYPALKEQGNTLRRFLEAHPDYATAVYARLASDTLNGEPF